MGRDINGELRINNADIDGGGVQDRQRLIDNP